MTQFPASSAARYERSMGRWSRKLAPLFAGFCGPMGPSVLDAGCGTGALSFDLAERGHTVLGVDLAEAYIADAAAKTMPGTRFETGDITALPAPSQSVDAALSMLVLHFVPDTAAALAELCRVTRPGGLVAATVWDSRGGLMFNRLFFDAAAPVSERIAARRGANYTRPTTRPGELAGALRAAGLADVVESTLVIHMTYSGFDDYWGGLVEGDGPLGALLAQEDPDAQRRIRDAVAFAYEGGEPDGPRAFAAVAWAAKGRVPM
ncbi:MAG: class I SAM-dependent methyltransferase [Pseudomonadota bacterium]